MKRARQTRSRKPAMQLVELLEARAFLSATDISAIVGTSGGAAVNTTPAVNAGAGQFLLAGGVLSRAGSFSDADAGDQWRATVNYGDGIVAALALNPDKTFSFSHQYVGAGDFTLTVSVEDAAHAVGSASYVISVLGATPATADFGLIPSIGVPSFLAPAGVVTAPPQQLATPIVVPALPVTVDKPKVETHHRHEVGRKPLCLAHADREVEMRLSLLHKVIEALRLFGKLFR